LTRRAKDYSTIDLSMEVSFCSWQTLVKDWLAAAAENRRCHHAPLHAFKSAAGYGQRPAARPWESLVGVTATEHC